MGFKEIICNAGGGPITGVRVRRNGKMAFISITKELAARFELDRPFAMIELGIDEDVGLLRVRSAEIGYKLRTVGAARMIRLNADRIGIEWLNQAVDCKYETINGLLIITLPEKDTLS